MGDQQHEQGQQGNEELLPGQKMPLSIAKEEIKGWLDFKKVSELKRRNFRDNTEILENALAFGVISIDERKFIKHHLVFPLANKEGETTVEYLEYRPRLTAEAIAIRTKGLRATETNAILLAYVGALCNKPAEIVARIDSEDLTVSTAVAAFFT